MNRAKPRSRILRRLPAVLLGVALGAPTAAGAQEPATISLVASPPGVTFGGDVELAGLLSTGPGCASGRTVEVQRQPSDSTEWETLSAVLTSEDGTFALVLAPSYSDAYRALARGTESCAEVASEPVPVPVAAAVVVSLASPTVRAGNCASMNVTVSPDKTGQLVRIQRLRSTRWRTIIEVALAEGSSAAAAPCFGWNDLGVVRLRARWVGQDDLNATGTSAPLELGVLKARWMRRIDRLTAGRAVSVSAREDGRFLYQRRDSAARVPASNQKLLLSMALLDRLGPDFRFVTSVRGSAPADGVVSGDVWLVGRGDPSVGRRDVARLARQMADAGIRRIRGSVVGSTAYFGRDWWAPGWKWYFPLYYVARPTATVYRFNQTDRRHLRKPEVRAARALTRHLEARGVRVRGDPGAGRPPRAVDTLAEIESPPLAVLVGGMNVFSSNFYAEVLGKRLGVARSGPPGTIAKGAAASAAWAEDHGVTWSAYDGSGLSSWNRVSASGVARLIGEAEAQPWGETLRGSLPRPGQGTLEGRLSGVRVRAKTGTLIGVSALSGWVWLERRGVWAEFSILSSGISKSTAVRIEDAVVRILSERAR